MGSSKKQTIGYKYFMGLHMGLCHGPVDSILEIRAGDRSAWKGAANGSGQIYIEAPELFGGEEREGGIQGALDVMMGEATQKPNEYLAAQQGTPQPAYRGLLSVVFRGPGANTRPGIQITVTNPVLVWAAGGTFTIPVTFDGSTFLSALIARVLRGRLTGLVAANNPYLKPWAFLVRRIAAGWATPVFLPSKASITVAGDVAAMNPAHIIYECLTNTEWGMGYPTGQLDAASFTAAADTFHAEGLGLCLAWQQQDTIQSFLQVVLDHAGGVLVQDRSTGLFKLRAIRGGYDVASLPLYGSQQGNVLAVPRIERATYTEAVNEITVGYVDAVTGKDGSVTVQNLAAIQAQGAVVPQGRQYPGLPNADLALRTALRDLQAATSGLARVTVTVSRQGHAIEPGDVLRFEWLPAGIEQLVLRVGSVDYGSLTDGAVTLECVEDVFSLPAASYVTPQDSLWTSPVYTPQASPFIAAFEAPYRELVQTLGASSAQALTATDAYLGVVAVKPAGITEGYNLQTRAGAAAYADAGRGDWCPSTTLSSAITQATTALPIAESPDLALVNPGELAMIGSGSTAEMVRVDAVNPDTFTLTVARGCLDTVPRSHASGTRVLFLDAYTATDGVLYASGEAVQGRALTRGATGLLDATLAPSATVTMAGRAARPYPPGNFRLNGAAYPASISGALTVSWAHRDRLLQDDQLVDTTAASIGPEVGTGYTLRLYDETGTLRRTETGITGTSYGWVTEIVDSGLVTFPAGEYSGPAWAQSSTGAGAVAATAANMRDGSNTTGTATGSSALEWVRADLGSAQSVACVAVQGGSVPGAAGVAALLNGCALEWSNDLSAWTSVATVSGVTDTGPPVFLNFAAVVARHWRLRRGAQVAVSEFRLFSGSGGSSRLNTSVRAELFAVRGGVESMQRHDFTVARV